MRLSILLLLFISISTMNTAQDAFYNFKIQQLDSDEIIDFSAFKGKKVLIVNVASKCGFTYQYEDLEKLHQEYNDKLVVIGLPCNQFLGQEPGSDEEIAAFCSTSYGVSFPMTTKIDVKGKNQHPLYEWLTQKSMNGVDDFKVGWNFNKFLIDENGQLEAYFPSKVKPLDNELTSLLQ